MERPVENMISGDQKRYDAIKYIATNEYGYIDDLIGVIGQKYVDEFKILGFICEGCTLERNTWKCLEFGKRYYDIIR